MPKMYYEFHINRAFDSNKKYICIIKSVIKIRRLFLLSQLSNFYEILRTLALDENSEPIQITSRKEERFFRRYCPFPCAHTLPIQLFQSRNLIITADFLVVTSPKCYKLG